MQGFFQESTLIRKPPALTVARCGACQLFEHCETPKQIVAGKGRRKILIVGDMPGKLKHFAGWTRRKLEEMLADVGIDLHKDCWTTSAIICRSKKSPTKNQLEWCHPNLQKTLRDLKPTIVIPLGFHAIKQVVGPYWKGNFGPEIIRWVGWQIPCHRPNMWICPTWNPSWLRHEKNPMMEFWMKRHLLAASKLVGRPWEKIPNYEKQVEVILNPQTAARRIRSLLMLGDFPAAFDYETNMLKPDSPKAKIVCCSICFDGKQTIAYPWAGDAIRATREFIRSRCKKIASNLDMEDRWTRKEFGHRVRGWSWDTMLNAHIADNRGKISSIKFQALVRLGVPIYNQHIERFLKSKRPNTPNRIDEVEMSQLLLYCGLDSLLEFLVAEKQAAELGFKPF